MAAHSAGFRDKDRKASDIRLPGGLLKQGTCIDDPQLDRRNRTILNPLGNPLGRCIAVGTRGELSASAILILNAQKYDAPVSICQARRGITRLFSQLLLV